MPFLMTDSKKSIIQHHQSVVRLVFSGESRWRISSHLFRCWWWWMESTERLIVSNGMIVLCVCWLVSGSVGRSDGRSDGRLAGENTQIVSLFSLDLNHYLNIFVSFLRITQVSFHRRSFVRRLIMTIIRRTFFFLFWWLEWSILQYSALWLLSIFISIRNCKLCLYYSDCWRWS